MPTKTKTTTVLTLLCAYFICMCHLLALHTAHAAIHARSGIAFNSVTNDKYAQDQPGVAAAAAAAAAATVQANNAAATENNDLMDKLSWKCANNASCLYGVANGIMTSYKRGETIKLSLFDLIKLPPLPAESGRKVKQKWSAITGSTGRGIDTFMDFIGGNAIRFPIGPMLFSVQRAEDDSDYIEVALLKKAVASSQGRLQGNGGGGLLGGGGGGGSGSGGGLLGGGGGGLLGDSSGSGGGLLGGRRRQKHQEQHDKKQFQMYIPMYLAATTFGWTMVAAKAVGLLTLKALLLSKIAFVVAAIVLVKKLMDNASEKMLYQYPEHTPYMMPYGLDYPMHGAEISTDMYPAALHLAAAGGGGGGAAGSGGPIGSHPGLESYASESHLHPNLADVNNNTQVLAALNAVGLSQKVKRRRWPRPRPRHRQRPMNNNWRLYRILRQHKRSKWPKGFVGVNSAYGRFGTTSLALAAAVAEANVEAEQEMDDDDDDDGENET